MPVVTTDGRLVLGLMRGDDRLEEAKARARSSPTSGRRRTTRSARRSAPTAARSGPSGSPVEIVADETLREGQFVAGANRNGWHLHGVEAGRDYEPRFADIREPREGDPCPDCGGALRFQTAIEVGHIFKFGTRYSEPLGATFLDEDGKEKPLSAAATASAPRASWRRPWSSATTRRGSSGRLDRAVRRPRARAARRLSRGARSGREGRGALGEAGYDVLLDDRDERPGEKFADADLVGCPLRVTVGKKTLDDGAVDVRERARERGARGESEVLKWVTDADGEAAALQRRAVRPDDRAADGGDGTTYRGLADKAGLSAGYLNHIVHGNRPVPSNDVIARIASALGVEPEHFREYRIRVITEKLEEMPELIDRLYKRLAYRRNRVRARVHVMDNLARSAGRTSRQEVPGDPIGIASSRTRPAAPLSDGRPACRPRDHAGVGGDRSARRR